MASGESVRSISLLRLAQLLDTLVSGMYIGSIAITRVKVRISHAGEMQGLYKTT